MYPKNRVVPDRCEDRNNGYFCTLQLGHASDHEARSDFGEVVTDGHLYLSWTNLEVLEARAREERERKAREQKAREQEDREVEEWLEANCR